MGDLDRLKAVAEARDALYQLRAEAYSASAKFDALRAMPDPKVIRQKLEGAKRDLEQLEKDKPKKKGFVFTTNQKEIDDHAKMVSMKKRDIEMLEKEYERTAKNEPARQARMQELEGKTYNSLAGKLNEDSKRNKDDLIREYAACVRTHGQESTDSFMLKAWKPEYLQLVQEGLSKLQRQARAQTRGQDRGGKGYSR